MRMPKYVRASSEFPTDDLSVEWYLNYLIGARMTPTLSEEIQARIHHAYIRRVAVETKVIA